MLSTKLQFPTASYLKDGPAAAEPTALTTLAALRGNNPHNSLNATDWLAELQRPDGAAPAVADADLPCWTTSLALLAWTSSNQKLRDNRYDQNIKRAINWALAAKGETIPANDQLGHNTALVGWPWVLGTHSWLEPTAWFVIALSAAGLREHPRVQEGIAILVDRLLPQGGCNSGNTIVFGQALLPHVQPTGLVMTALAGEQQSDPRIERSLEFLKRALTTRTSAASLCYGLMGLSAHARRPGHANRLLGNISRESLAGDGGHLAALVQLASFPDGKWSDATNVEPANAAT